MSQRKIDLITVLLENDERYVSGSVIERILDIAGSSDDSLAILERMSELESKLSSLALQVKNIDKRLG